MLLILLCLQYSQGYSLCYVDHASDLAENAALNKPATQVSTYSIGTASKAVDGDTNPRWTDGSCTHTRWKKGLPLYTWWMVDLEREYRVDSVSITNRLQYAKRLHDFDIFVSLNNTFEDDAHMADDSLCFHVSGIMGNAETRTFNCQTPIFGQFVQIYMETLDKRDLIMCEVTVQGYPAICVNEITTSKEIKTLTTALDVSSTATTTTPKKTSVATAEKITPPMSTSKTTGRNQAVSATSLPSNNTTTTTPTCECSCGVPSNHTNLTQEALMELIKELRNELEVNKRETSIYKRKLISVGDERQSAEAIGFVGVLALCVPILLIVSFDLINLWSFAKQKRNRVIPK